MKGEKTKGKIVPTTMREVNKEKNIIIAGIGYATV